MLIRDLSLSFVLFISTEILLLCSSSSPGLFVDFRWAYLTLVNGSENFLLSRRWDKVR